MKPAFDEEVARELGYQKYYPELKDWIVVIIAVLGCVALVMGTIIYFHLKLQKNTPVETKDEIITEQVRVEYKDLSERELDVYGCPINGDFFDETEYQRCTKVRQEKFLPEWKEKTEWVVLAAEKLPDCALSWFPEVACMQSGKIVLPVK